MKNERSEQKLEQTLGRLKYQFDDSFTDLVMSELDHQLPERKPGRSVLLLMKGLTIAAAASIVLVLGVTFALDGSLSMDSLLGIDGFSELDLYDAIQNGTYEN